MPKASSSFTSNVLKLITGSAFAQGLGVLVTPIITRIFAPEAFGIAALVSSIAGIIGIVACLRYELSIMLPENDDEAANLLILSICFVFIITGTTTFIIFLCGDIIVSLLNSPQLTEYLWLVPIATFASGIFLSLNYWNSRTKHFGRLSIARVISSVTAQTTKLAAGFSGFVSGGVLIGATILGSFVSTSVLSMQVWRDDNLLFKTSVSWKKMILGLKRYRKFPLIDMWGGLLNTISWHLPALLLATFFSPVIVGYYALGTAVIKRPMNLIGGAIAQVFYQKATDAKNAGETADIVEKVFKRLVAIGLFPTLVICIVGRDIFSVFFGHNWSEAGLYTQILAPWIFLTFISSPLSTLFFVFERQGSALVIHSVIFLTRFLSLYIGGVLGNVYIALTLFSISGVFVYGGLAIWNMKLANVPTYIFFITISKYIVYFLPVGLCFFFLKYWIHISPVASLVISALTIIAYELIIFKRDNALKRYVNFSKLGKKTIKHPLT